MISRREVDIPASGPEGTDVNSSSSSTPFAGKEHRFNPVASFTVEQTLTDVIDWLDREVKVIQMGSCRMVNVGGWNQCEACSNL
jgi:hypothetical protein